jgi:hypothetical protein
MINFIKENYIDEWIHMTNKHSIKCIKGKLRTIYHNKELNNSYLPHENYKWYNNLKKNINIIKKNVSKNIIYF